MRAKKNIERVRCLSIFVFQPTDSLPLQFSCTSWQLLPSRQGPILHPRRQRRPFLSARKPRAIDPDERAPHPSSLCVASEEISQKIVLFGGSVSHGQIDMVSRRLFLHRLYRCNFTQKPAVHTWLMYHPDFEGPGINHAKRPTAGRRTRQSTYAKEHRGSCSACLLVCARVAYEP